MTRQIGISGRAVSIALIAIMVSASAAGAQEVRVGRVGPSYHFTSSEGLELSSSDFRGKVVIINFWATWCVPCKAELPMLDAQYRSKKDLGLRVVAVTPQEGISPVRLQKAGASLAMMMTNRFRGAYAPLAALPTNYIIDRAGVVRYAKSGAFSSRELDSLLAPLLGEPAPKD
jgi:thiol-disulfide isomerase/thioredoxin